MSTSAASWVAWVLCSPPGSLQALHELECYCPVCHLHCCSWAFLGCWYWEPGFLYAAPAAGRASVGGAATGGWVTSSAVVPEALVHVCHLPLLGGAGAETRVGVIAACTASGHWCVQVCSKISGIPTPAGNIHILDADPTAVKTGATAGGAGGQVTSSALCPEASGCVYHLPLLEVGRGCSLWLLALVCTSIL